MAYLRDKWQADAARDDGAKRAFDFCYTALKHALALLHDVRLLCELSRVLLDSLEARLCPVDYLDKRPPWKAEGRTMQDQ
ncbi:MAG: hypothetical protein ACI97K_003332 [Glaciecola sp.]|jgi:hypothetical protein